MGEMSVVYHEFLRGSGCCDTLRFGSVGPCELEPRRNSHSLSWLQGRAVYTVPALLPSCLLPPDVCAVSVL